MSEEEPPVVDFENVEQPETGENPSDEYRSADDSTGGEDTPADEDVQGLESSGPDNDASAGYARIAEAWANDKLPAVIDLAVLLQPIAGDNPSGNSLRYEGVYDEIAEARRADDNLNQGEWQTELKVADFQRVIDLAIPALSQRSKDLQIAAWLTESLVKRHGFTGLRDGVRLLGGFQEIFWDTLYPEIDEGDMEGRANAISWMESAASFAIKDCPITAVRGCSFNDFEGAKGMDSGGAEATEGGETQNTDADGAGRVTPEILRSAVAQSNRSFYEALDATLDECTAAISELNRINEEKYDRNQTPGLGLLTKSLDDVHSRVKKVLEAKRLEEPDEADFAQDGQTAEADGSGGTVSGGGGGPVQSRTEAIRRLGEIAAYFQRTEPHSPVAYLVQRAVKWGNMPLENWLKDVIKDESVLFQIRETLGLDTGSASGGSSDGAESTESASTEWT